ncbi:MAG: hypothetical protein H7X80_06815 [bacterium]|nr:hypothetical protein [Candidatus Kapabacteria bacterium]
MNKLIIRFALPLLLVASGITMTGCLMIERKEYLFLVREDGSGQGRIMFDNIASVQESETDQDQATKDYTQLLNEYIKGKKFEEENPSYMNVKKRLFEKDGKLHGEVTFEFLSYEDVGLFRLDGVGPWMYHTGVLNGVTVEQLDSSNGTYGGARMPVIFWKEPTSEFRIVTKVEEPEKGITRSLLPLYKRIGTN